jgi:replication initiation and membrane attachment protein DnaB
MSCNLGQKNYRIDQSDTHVKLVNEIADIKSLLNNSTQKTKELKAQLNQVAKKKKDAGKSPQNIQAPSNRVNTPIPKIQGLLIETASPATTNDSGVSASAATLTVSPATTNNSMLASVTSVASQKTDVQPEDQTRSKSNAEMYDHAHHALRQDLPQPHAVLPSVLPSLNFDWEMQVDPRFEIPSFNFDLDLFNQMLEHKTIPEPTSAELAAHAFLRTVLEK